MSPENAIVFIAEDDRIFREISIEIIEASSHHVAVVASTLQEALSGIEEAKRKGVNVAVVDGNLTKRDVSGNDGRLISEEIRKQIPNIKIISFSSSEQIYGDVHVDKDDIRKLGKTIQDLPDIS